MGRKPSAIFFCFVVFVIIYLIKFNFSAKQSKLKIALPDLSFFFPSRPISSQCKLLLEQFEPRFPSILLDLNLLKDIEADNCRALDISKGKVKIAVSVDKWKLLEPSDFEYYDIMLYEDTKERNYIKIFGGVTRAMPKMTFSHVGNWRLPTSLYLFSEYWRRSPMIDCLAIHMNRTESEPYLPILKSLESLSSLMKLFISHKMFPYLIEGTLLGWYRECGIIPHTTDLDFAVLIEEYNPKLLDTFLSERTEFSLYRTLGKPNDTFEITVYTPNNPKIRVDIFFMYNNGRNQSWIGGTGGDGQKYHYIFPLYDPFCSADILGHMFWVTCRPDTMLKFSYGLDYKKDVKSSDFIWNKSANNTRLSGKWSKAELYEIYKSYTK